MLCSQDISFKNNIIFKHSRKCFTVKHFKAKFPYESTCFKFQPIGCETVKQESYTSGVGIFFTDPKTEF